MHHFAPHRFTRNGTDTLTIEKSPLNRYSSRTIFEADSRTEVAQSPSNTRKRSRTSVTISAGAFASKPPDGPANPGSSRGRREQPRQSFPREAEAPRKDSP